MIAQNEWYFSLFEKTKCRNIISIATFAVVFLFVCLFVFNMAERFPEIELEETQELKENAANKNTKKKSTKRHSLYVNKSRGSDH